jgi:hypothetical protein
VCLCWREARWEWRSVRLADSELRLELEVASECQLAEKVEWVSWLAKASDLVLVCQESACMSAEAFPSDSPVCSSVEQEFRSAPREYLSD